MRELCPILVGNGLQTDFWRNVWLGSHSLSIQFPHICTLDDMQVVSVADTLRLGWQSSTLRREPRGGVESTQWAAISYLIREFFFF